MNKELLKVDVIRPGSINSIIGPVGTLKRILKNQEYFNSRGYDVTVFSQESIQIGPIKVPPVANYSVQGSKPGLRRMLSSYLRMKAKSNLFLAKWYLNRSRKGVEDLVNYYLSLDRQPDIIQFHSDLECYLYLKKMKNKKAKTVMFLHSDGIPFKMELQYYPILEGSSYLKKLKEEFDYTIRNVDKIVFIAKIGQSNFLKRFPYITCEDTSVIINGIDDLTAIQREEINAIRMNNKNTAFHYRLCCTGTINTRKGHRYIIEALHNLPSDLLAQVHVDFMGDGGERPVLEELVKKYGLEKHVTFYGMVPNVEVYKYLAQNNIYILMSQNEGLPISIIEAMRAGMPIISTKVSGIPELVDEGHNGFLLNPDSKELVELLKNLPQYNWEQMGKESRSRYEKDFTFDRMEREFCDMYDGVIGRKS